MQRPGWEAMAAEEPGGRPVSPLISTIRVGVSGHRPNRLRKSDPTMLREQVRVVLGTVRDEVVHLVNGSPDSHRIPHLHVLSSLAEGADRLVAAVALSLGFELEVPLPLPRKDYEHDFATEASRAEFHTLLAHARCITEPPVNSNRPLAYRAAGEAVLAACDVLLVIFDGKPASGPGGTPELVDMARRTGVPLIRIDADAPHAIHVDGSTDPLATVKTLCHRLVQAQA